MATYRFMRAFTPDPNPEVLGFFRRRLDSILAIAERHFERIPFATSQRPTVADLSMSAYLSYPAEETGYDLPTTHPAIAAWLGRIAALPGWCEPYDLLPRRDRFSGTQPGSTPFAFKTALASGVPRKSMNAFAGSG